MIRDVNGSNSVGTRVVFCVGLDHLYFFFNVYNNIVLFIEIMNFFAKELEIQFLVPFDGKHLLQDQVFVIQKCLIAMMGKRICPMVMRNALS